MKIEEGKHYKSRNGAIFGPFARVENTNTWKASGFTWFNDGNYDVIDESAFDLIEEVTVNEPFSTFPTWGEFKEQFPYDHVEWLKKFYNFFRDRVQTLEIGQEYEFSDEGEVWVRDTFTGYKGRYDPRNYIRPIQYPNKSLIDRLKAVDDPTGAVADAIKALEGEE